MASAAVGRPSEYTEDLGKAICERVATSDLSSKAIAEEFGINRDTIYVWRLRYPEFSEAYARAKEHQQELMAELIMEDAQGPTKDSMTAVTRDRLKVDTRKWLMAKLAPKKYADRLEHTGADGQPLQLIISVPVPKREEIPVIDQKLLDK